MNELSTILIIICAALITINLLVTLFRKAPDHVGAITSLIDKITSGNVRVEKLVRDESGSNRMELANNLKQFSELNNQHLEGISKHMYKQLDDVDASLKNITTTVDKRLQELQRDNSEKLEKMRVTVDEKLQSTLETRLGKSFELVSKQLEAVQQGLGEMRSLATGVGDLKKVLMNVKTRGILGEVMLGNILEQIFSPDQYAANISTRPNSSQRVEFAIKFPGKDDELRHIWLPIDSKFPMDRYEALINAYDVADKDLIATARKQLVNALRLSAKTIHDSYIEAPFTTDFAILFLPTESLYAEVTRIPGLIEDLRGSFHIILAGPNILAAMLSSLQMGFRTLAIEKRSSEVWKVLGAVKSEFGKFGDVLDGVQKKLNQASTTIDKAHVRTRAIERQLRGVEELPPSEAVELLENEEE